MKAPNDERIKRYCMQADGVDYPPSAAVSKLKMDWLKAWRVYDAEVKRPFYVSRRKAEEAARQYAVLNTSLFCYVEEATLKPTEGERRIDYTLITPFGTRLRGYVQREGGNLTLKDVADGMLSVKRYERFAFDMLEGTFKGVDNPLVIDRILPSKGFQKEYESGYGATEYFARDCLTRGVNAIKQCSAIPYFARLAEELKND